MIRTGWLLLLLPLAVVSAALFYISQEVQDLRRDLGGLNGDIAEERDSIRVLRAEWAYLNRPEWLEELAEEAELDLAPIRGGQIIASVDTIPMPLPDSPRASAAQQAAAPFTVAWSGSPVTVAVLGAPAGYQAMPLPMRRPPEEPPLMFAGIAGHAPAEPVAVAPAAAAAAVPQSVAPAAPAPAVLPPERPAVQPPPMARQPAQAPAVVVTRAPVPVQPAPVATDAPSDGAPLMLRVRR